MYKMILYNKMANICNKVYFLLLNIETAAGKSAGNEGLELIC